MPLLHSTYYHIILYSPWNLEYDAYIIGTVSKTTVSEIEDFDIRSTYFDDYGLGLATYINTVKNSTPIYMVNLITKKTPIEIDTKKIFIPESLIDFNKTYQYLIGSIPNFTLTIDPKYFKTSLRESEFSKMSSNKIINTLNIVEPFIADTISVSYSSTQTLLVQEDINSYETITKEKLEFIKAAKVQSKINDEARLNELYLKKTQFDTAKATYEAKVIEYNNLIEEIAITQKEIERENDILRGVRNVMIEIIDQIKTSQILVNNFPTFYELYEQVKNDM